MVSCDVRRPRRLAVAGALGAALVAIGAGAASGHVPGVGNGLAPSTNGPDLRSVTLFPNNLTDAVPEKARFCFDENIDIVAPAAGTHFAIRTYDADRVMSAATAVKATDDAHCADASFAPGTDLAQGTIGEVAPGAATDLQGASSQTADEPLTGSVVTAVAGATTAPDLVAVTVQSPTQATYRFDETVDPAPSTPYSPLSFGYFNAAGVPIVATAGTVQVSADAVVVTFPGAVGLQAATRFFVTPGAVQDLPQSFAIPVTDPLATPSAAEVLATAPSSLPEATAAAPQGGGVYKVTFSKPMSLTGANLAGFLLINDNATLLPAATGVSAGGDADSILVTFPASVGDDPTGPVRLLVADKVITAADGTPNILSEVPVGTPNSRPGFTDGPDLLSVARDAATNRVTFNYDETVNATPLPAASVFQAFAADGSQIASTGAVVVNDKAVTVSFPSTVANAVMFANVTGAVTDKTGRVNPSQSVSAAIETAPVGAVAPPVAPTAPGIAKPPTVVPRYKTTITIHRRGARYFGTVSSKRKGCRSGRHVILTGKGSRTSRGSAFTSAPGRYSIRRGRRLRGRVLMRVSERKGTVDCAAATSRTIKG